MMILVSMQYGMNLIKMIYKNVLCVMKNVIIMILKKYDKIEIGEMSDYEYNKFIIEQIKSAEVDKFKRQMAEDIKNNRSGFGLFMGTLFSTLVLQPLSGATEQLDNINTFFNALGSGIESVLTGGRFDEGFASAYGSVNAYGDVITEAKGQNFQSFTRCHCRF